jgi:hypothetical protein
LLGNKLEFSAGLIIQTFQTISLQPALNSSMEFGLRTIKSWCFDGCRFVAVFANTFFLHTKFSDDFQLKISLLLSSLFLSNMKKLFIVIIFSGLIFQAFAQTREVPFTLDDRDRIMRTEERIESLRNEMNAKFDAVETRFEALETKIDAVNSKFEPLYWAFGILITLMFFILGFIIWDRRTALNPIQHKTYSIEERMNKLENVFREQAKKDPAFAELLKIAGLL